MTTRFHLNFFDRIHLALHLSWGPRGGLAPWICRLLVRCGGHADVCQPFSVP